MNTDWRYLTLKIIICILYAVSFSASLVGLISSTIDYSTNYACDNGFLSLKIWQIVYGCVRIPILITLVLSYECIKISKSDTPILMVILISLYVGLLFDVVWSIIGSINLFEFSFACRYSAFRLWVITLYCLSVEYVSILVYIGHSIFVNKKLQYV